MLPAFEYHRPASLPQACRLLNRLPEAWVLAGGTDLLVDLSNGLKVARNVISLRGINGLEEIREIKEGLSIGAACTARRIESSPLIGSHFPELVELVQVFASPPVRTLATVGGNLCSAVACGDFPVLLIALGARVELISTEGKRRLDLGDFFSGNRRTMRRRDEVLSRILVPLKPPTAQAVYLKFQRRASNSLAVAGVAVYLDLQEGICRKARVVLGAVAPTPLVAAAAAAALEGNRPDEDTITRAAELARKAARPISDLRGSAEYRRELVEVLTRRALQKVIDTGGTEG